MLVKLKNDLVSGFSVFLLALPLCLGIAIASNFPPIAGILSAIVGGILASLLGGAKLSIKGPAAGLIVITLSAVYELGAGDLQLGYERTLAVGVVAAIVQLLIAVTKQGTIAEIMPPSVIHGMLAAIGVIIVSKQIYVMTGITPTTSEPLELLMEFPTKISHLNPMIFLLGLLSFSIVSLWPLIKKFSFVPSSIVILITIIPLSIYFKLNEPHFYYFMGKMYAIQPGLLISLPNHFLDAIHFPDFSLVLSIASIKYAVMFALVGSIESLLTVCAIDSLAPHMAPSDLNKDLRAIGIANLVSAFIGGLPMISEIVRSKANIDYGATSPKANFFHGLFMLVAVLMIPGVMNLIPLSALAALLVFVGIKLASPKEFIHAYKIGIDQIFIFLATFVVTLSVDLLVGVASGMTLKVLIHVLRRNNIKNLFNPIITVKKSENSVYIHINGPLTFAGYLKLKKYIIKNTAITKNIIINLCHVTYLDHTVLKKLQTLENELSGIKITIEDNQNLVSLYNHPLSVRGKAA